MGDPYWDQKICDADTRLFFSCIRDYWSGDAANAIAYPEEDDLDYVAVDRGIELSQCEVAVFW